VEILPPGQYLTACYARLNRSVGSLTVISMGHPPMLFLPGSGSAELIRVDGDILGMFKDAQFGIHRLSVAPGDRFALYTDGLVESSRRRITWESGVRSLLPLMESTRGETVGGTPSGILAGVGHGRDALEDDILLLVVEV
jgi:sigma-B regulation protein RsbU (phosphoserine phosphatase)